MRGVEARDCPQISLVELVSVAGIAKEIFEVVKEVKAAADREDIDAGRTLGVRAGPSARNGIAPVVPAIGRIKRAIHSDLPGRDRTSWDLVRGVPFGSVGHACQGGPVLRITLTIACDDIDLLEFVWIDPRAVVATKFSGDQQITRADLARSDA